MRAVIKIVQTALLVVSAVFILISTFLVISKYLLTEDLSERWGYSLMCVENGEMEPTFSTGDLLVSAEKDTYSSGTVITYLDADELKVSRIVGEHAKGVIIRVDSTSSEDDEFLLDEHYIKGEVLVSVSFMGFFLWALESPVSLAILVVFFVLILILPRLLLTNSSPKPPRQNERSSESGRHYR